MNANLKELLELAYKEHKSYVNICKITGLNNSTLRRIRLGLGKGKWHPKTVGKLMKAFPQRQPRPIAEVQKDPKAW